MVFVILAVNGIWTFLGDFSAVKRYLHIFRQKNGISAIFHWERYLGKNRAVKRYWHPPPGYKGRDGPKMLNFKVTIGIAKL